MKTLELKLKKYVLIVDAENGFNHFKIYDDEIGFIFIENCIPRKELVKGSYKFICKGSELTEEMASELCHNIGNCLTIEGNAYLNDEHEEVYFEFAQEAIISAVESKGFHWLENPIEKPKYYDKILTRNCLIWQEAEEKTFKNPLIFVKKYVQ